MMAKDRAQYLEPGFDPGIAGRSLEKSIRLLLQIQLKPLIWSSRLKDPDFTEVIEQQSVVCQTHEEAHVVDGKLP